MSAKYLTKPVNPAKVLILFEKGYRVISACSGLFSFDTVVHKQTFHLLFEMSVREESECVCVCV